MALDRKMLSRANVTVSGDEYERYSRAFSSIDADNSGEINVQELGDMLRWLGKPMDLQRVKDIVKRYDEDSSGEIGFTEFVILMKKQGIPMGDSELRIVEAPQDLKPSMLFLHKAGLSFTDDEVMRLRKVFLLLDTDHSGEMDIDEFALVLKYLGLSHKQEDTARVFRQFDQDNSGTIQFNEFLVLIHQKGVKITNTDIKVIEAMLRVEQ